MTAKMCPTHDQIAGRSCRYYESHGGKHNFGLRLDHDCSLERELRRALDEMIKARDEACDIADSAFKLQGDFIGHHNKRGSVRIAELRKVGD